jgi:hypothetical protein
MHGQGKDRRSSKRGMYLLSGIIECTCGARLHGQTRTARDLEWRYYLCRRCDASSIPADETEAAVLSHLRSMLLPAAAVEAARDELRRRLALPSRGAADEFRARLGTRLNRLKSQFEWGDISETEYRAKMQETRTELGLLPEADKVMAFDQVAGLVASLDAAMEAPRSASRTWSACSWSVSRRLSAASL